MRLWLVVVLAALLAAQIVATPAAADDVTTPIQPTPETAGVSQPAGAPADDVMAAAAPRRRVQVGQVPLSALVRTDSLYPEPRVTPAPTPMPSLPPGVPQLPAENRTAPSVAPWMLAAGASLLAAILAALTRRPSPTL